MKRAIYLKSIFLLCLLLAGAVNAHADDYDYEWAKVTDLSDVNTNDVVLLVDVNNKIALSSENDFMGIGVTINDDGSIDDNVPQETIKWKVTKSQNEVGQTVFSFTRTQYTGLLYGYTTGELSFEENLNSSDHTSKFRFDNYGENGGNLGFMFNTYLGWENRDGKYYGRIKDSAADITLYKRAKKNYVKWKRVDGQTVKFSQDEENVIVVVEQNSEKALGNDKEDKDPDAVAVTLNDEQDRIIMDEVPEKVQWIYNGNKNQGAWFTTKDGKHLYADTSKDDPVLRVGEGDETNIYFDYGTSDFYYESLWITKGEGENKKSYLFSVDDSMFSNVWKLKELTDDFHENHLFYYKKVVDPQKVVKIDMAEYYSGFLTSNPDDNKLDLKAKITGADFSEITWSSSDNNVATVANGIVTMKKRGSVVITAYVEEDTENHYYDKASAKCTVVIDDKSSEELGSMLNPLTVQQAKELIESDNVKAGVYYYIKGKVSKVNSGMMAMFGDMDFGEMMGDSGSGMNFEDSMDDMDFDPEDMEESGFDMSSFDMSSFGFDMSAMFGTSDKVTYYISDDGTKDNQLKVLNGCGVLETNNNGAYTFSPIPKMSPGDCVIVCGPLVNTEDTNMFSSMMGGNSSEEPKMSGKVDEMNYLAVYDPTLLVEDKEIYVNKSSKVEDGGYTDYLLQKGLYSIDNLFNKYDGYNDEVKITDLNQIKEATFKSSDEDIVKWDDEKKELVGVNEGKAKITVKVKVVLQEKDDNADPKVEEKSYTMKRKFKVIVKTRDLDPAGYYDGEWVLTTKTDDLKEGTRLVLVGTRVKEGKDPTDYMMVENNAMMGGGKNGSKIEFEDSNKETIPSSTVTSKKGLEVILEKDKVNESLWMLKVGINEENEPLYLYATYAPEEEQQQDPEEEDEQEGNKFDMKKMMEMFSPSSGMKVGTIDEANQDAQDNDVTVSLKASISFTEGKDIATIKFDGIPDEYNNTIMLSSSFDMEEMMGMFGGMGNKEEETTTGDEPTEDDDNNEKSTFDMGSFDMFMASFNTKKPGDENPTVDEETGEEKTKCFMPRIYRFVPNTSYNITIGSTEWKTIVSYKDVQVPENVEAYIVTKVTPEDGKSVASLKPVQIKDGKQVLKGGEPYLLHYTSQAENYTMTLLTPNDPDELEAPIGNLLKKSDRKTSGTKDGSTVYVLAYRESFKVGFYRWTGDDLGAGRVYLTGKAHENPNTTNAHEFVGFFVDETGEATAIESIDDFKANVGPFYDLQGRRVDNPTKGIYIVNGKKIVIK